MTTLKESALAYEPETPKTVADLQSLSVDATVKEATDKDRNGVEYTYYYVEFNGISYRVPRSVMSTIKVFLEKRPNLKTISVTKDGEGRNTKYTVVPLD